VVYLLGIDVGTSSTKSILIDERGQVIGSADHSHPTSSPTPGFQEQDPQHWWQGVRLTIRRILEETEIRPNQIAGLSLSGQGCACLPVDRMGQPLGPAIIWTDTRSVPQQSRLRQIFGTELGRLTGNDIYDQPEPRMLWIRDHQPDVYRNTYKFLTTVSYLLLRFTGKLAGNLSDWGFHLAFDRSTRSWNTAFCRAAGLDESKLPDIYASYELVGSVTEAAAAETGLLTGTPVVAGGQDSTVVALAVGALEAGQSVVMRGTTDLLCLCTTDGGYHPGLYTTFAVLPNLYIRYDMKEVVAAGGSYHWLAGVLFTETGKARFRAMDDLAAAAPAGSNGLLYLPYLLISTQPDLTQQRAGSFFGLTTTTSRADLCRAVMEGTACALRETIARLAANDIRVSELRLTGGPAESDLWNQITADVTGLPVLVPAVGSGAAAYGAALLAGLGVGVIPMDDRYETLRRLVVLRRSFRPRAQFGPIYDHVYAAFCQLASGTAGIAAQLKADILQAAER